jgi:ipoprotein LpqH
VLFAGLTGCSSQDAGQGHGRVSFGNRDIGEVTGVGCTTDNGQTTVTLDATQQTTVVLTEGDAPQVQSVKIGEAGADGPSLAYVQGVGAPATVTRNGDTYTVSGTGVGSDGAHPEAPVNTPFEIEASCS